MRACVRACVRACEAAAQSNVVSTTDRVGSRMPSKTDSMSGTAANVHFTAANICSRNSQIVAVPDRPAFQNSVIFP